MPRDGIPLSHQESAGDFRSCPVLGCLDEAILLVYIEEVLHIINNLAFE